MNHFVASCVFLAVPSLSAQLASQTSDRDSIRAVRDTIVIVGTRWTILSPVNLLSRGDLFSSPGGFHDPLRAVDQLPFTTPASDLQAQPSIGGDDPDRVLTLLDGFEIIAPYRFLGAFSMFNPLLIRSINATTTGYPARYGGFFPSAIEVQSDNEYVRHPSVSAELTLPVSQVAVGLPLDSSAGFSVRAGLRTSHLFLVRPLLSIFAKDQNLDAFLPGLKDAQWGMTFIPSRTFSAHQAGIVADERGSIQSFERTFSYSWKRLFQGVSMEWEPRNNWILTGRISLQNNDVNLGSVFPLESVGEQAFAMSSIFRQANVSSEADISVSATADVAFGGEIKWKHAVQSFISSSEYLRLPLPSPSSFTERALFGQAHAVLWDQLELTVGERIWYSGLIRAGGSESRLSFGLKLFSSTRVEGGYGQYSQPPSDVQVLYGYLSLLAQPNQPPRLLLMSQSRTDLAPEESRVFFARVHHAFVASSSIAGLVTAEIFRKRESAVILSARYPGVFTPLDSNSFQPSQRFEGDKWGIGVSLFLSDALLGASASASYARQSSTVKDIVSTYGYRAGSDRQHLFKAMIKFERFDWDISATYQYYSGSPTTDRYFVRSTGIFGNTFFVPVWKGLNSGRLPPYNRLDVFIGKSFEIESWKVTPYVDIVNVLNSKNISQYDYTLNESNPPEYVNANPVYNSLPLFPMIGVRLRKEW